MVRRGLFIVVAAALLLSLSGCESAPKLAPKGRTVIALRPDKDAIEANVQMLDEVVIELPPIKDPANHWEVVFNDIRFLQQLRPIAPAASGGYTVSFLAVRQGRRPVRFYAVPPNAREATPTQGYQVMVQIE